ncbi:MAG: hypothetical protein QNK36_10585 [Colwellia sp.]|nr:hypothetical protein [Colwellia sp.]
MQTRPDGTPKESDFVLQNELLDTSSLKQGQFLIKVNYLSLDPYMRGRMSLAESYAEPLQEGDIVTGETVGIVIASNSEKYPVTIQSAGFQWELKSL